MQIELCKSKVNLVTLRYPTPARYLKMYNSLKKRFDASLLTGTIAPTVHLRMNLGTVMSYVNLFGKFLCNTKPTIIDINALTSARLSIRESTVVDFRTPLSYELKWLGHSTFSAIASINERMLKKIGLITASNEHMVKYCKNLGAQNVLEVPNYPTKDFFPTIDAVTWKAKNGIAQTKRVVLFTGGVRVREIYGIDLLLESWRLVEGSNSNVILVILGDDSIDYIRQKARSLRLKHVLLPGRVSSKATANWVNSADLCLAPRTPGFTSAFYNHKDSTKISEYAALRKPIVATCYAKSDQYLLVDSTPECFSEGILKGLDGKISQSTPHFWEDNETFLLESLERFWQSKN